MGTFAYDSTLKAEFDDRALAHLQIVIGAKLRRGESFYFSWRDAQAVGDGRTTVWMHPGVGIVYKYHGSRMPTVNPAWIQELSESANSPAGLQIMPEPAPPVPRRTSRLRTQLGFLGLFAVELGRVLGDRALGDRP